MKHPEYDSPLELVMSDITTQFAKQIDEECWQAIQRVGINVDKDKLLIALKQDAERYREAFRMGEETGYTKRDEELVRCKDCKNADYGTDEDGNRFMKCIGSVKCYGGTTPDFFCADGERQDGR